MPVVSQSMISPMVPVGAMTVTWALRNPCRSPSSSIRSHSARAAASRSGGQTRGSMPTGETVSPSYSAGAALYAARRWLRTTRSMDSRFASYRGNGPTSEAISADAADAPACMMAVSAPHWARPSAESYGMPWTISSAPRLA